jgi:arylformamidase
MQTWIYLSHKLSPKHFAYGNGESIKIKYTNKISSGDSSNNTKLNLPTHFGTHLDFPYHFENNGKKGEEFSPDYFISNKVQFLDLGIKPITNYLITENDFAEFEFNPNTEILIIKTGMGDYLKQDAYWNANPGYVPELAGYFKEHMPNLRIIGFDSISLTGRKFREEGKGAHKSFLIENNILILEDMNLSKLFKDSTIEEIIISPLRFDGMDGAPTTVIAKVNHYINE